MQGLQLKVLANRRNKLFLDKEAQMVINQYYDEKIRKRHFMKLLRYCLFLALLTWLGIFMTTRDTTSAYFMQSGYYAKVRTAPSAKSRNCELPLRRLVLLADLVQRLLRRHSRPDRALSD